MKTKLILALLVFVVGSGFVVSGCASKESELRSVAPKAIMQQMASHMGVSKVDVIMSIKKV